MEEIEIPLEGDEKKEKIEFLRKRKFKDFKIHGYYWRSAQVKHGVEIKEIEEIYPMFDKIIKVFKRPAKNGYKYSFIYELEETKSLYLCFYLDETPPQFFNAYYDYTRQGKKVAKKVRKWMLREHFNKK